MNDKVILTQEGFNKIKEELEHLKKIELPAAIERLKNARELGDLAENADYSQAREQQAFIGGKIEELENKLKYAEIINTGSSTTQVTVGRKVELDCSGRKELYHIVGENESDPVNGKISINSPVAQAIVGKKLGEVVIVKIPAGQKECKIVKII